MATPDMLAQQVALYGEPLQSRFARLLAAYRMPQSRLAATIGLSAPMLSQLASGQRVKISNPAVLARLLRLEELSRSPGVTAGDPAAIGSALAEVNGSSPQLTTAQARTQPTPHPSALGELAAAASAAELRRAAAAVPGSALAALLSEAAARAR